MKHSKRLINILAVLIFIVGTILGMGVFGLAAWGDMEAFLFDSSVRQEGRMKLSCPVMINDYEYGKVGVTLDNPLEKTIKNRVQAHISQGYVTLIKEYLEKVQLEPGEKIKLEWKVQPKNAAYNDLIVMAKVRTLPTYPLTDRQGSCGILVIDVFNLTGSQTFSLGIALSIGFIAAGSTLWGINNRPVRGRTRDTFRVLIALGLLVIVGIVTSLLGWWLLGAFTLVLMLFVVIAFTASVLQR